MSRYIILVLASIGLISIGVVIYFEIGELYDSFSDDHKYWKREVNALDEPEYSLEAYKKFGGEFRMRSKDGRSKRNMRLIDADALRDKLQAEIDKVNPPFDGVLGSIRCGVRLARNMVEDEPTVDVVRYGHWYDEPNYLGTSKTMFFCSVCGSASFREDPYCWHCGAKMEVKNEQDI